MIPETHDVTTLVLSPEHDSGFSYLPGQCMFLTPLSHEVPREEHPFIISSSPAVRKVISATIKASGEFTRQAGCLSQGDRVLVDGPYGNFSFLARSYTSRFVFIAGGVAVTPLMSMLRFLRDTSDKAPC